MIDNQACRSDSKSDGGLDLDDVHDDLVEQSVLRHDEAEGGSNYLVFEDLEEGPFEEAAPDEVLLAGLPLHRLDGVQQLHLPF
jgi:hypothetical protein